MNAMAQAALQAPDAPRDPGRPLPIYTCRNCWHSFPVMATGRPDGGDR
jgi:hypothetical protein